MNKGKLSVDIFNKIYTEVTLFINHNMKYEIPYRGHIYV